MPLSMLVLLVLVAVAAIALPLRLGDRPKRAPLTAETARAAWLRQFSGDAVRQVTVSHDGHAALILSDEGNGLLWTLDAGPVARRLEDYDLIDEGTGLRIVFHDLTSTEATLTLDDFERQHWLNLMGRT